MKNKTCVCFKHLAEAKEYSGLACIEAIFKSYRVPYSKKETLSEQIVLASNIIQTKATNEDKSQRIMDLFKKETPLLKTVNLILKEGNKKFVDFSSDLIGLMMEFFKTSEMKHNMTKTEVYKGLYVKENMVDYLDKFFKKDEYMFFSGVT